MLLHGNGLKIREISKKLELDVYYVADVLFSTDCIKYWYQNDSSLWFAKENTLDVEEPEEEDSLIQNVIVPQNINTDSFLINEPGCSLSIYIQEISNYRIYSEEEINELFSRYRKGDNVAYNLLIKSHLRLVANIARLYKSKGLHLCDLIQEGNIGLLKAVEKFDHTKNNRFVEYAKSWILQAISSSVVNLPNIVRIPQNQIYLHRKLQKLIEKFEHQHEYEPSISQIELDVDMDSLSLICNFPRRLNDITVLVDDWEEYSDKSGKSTDHVLLKESDNYYINNLLHFLKKKKREASILKSYYGIDQPLEETLSSIGDRYNLTRERTRQIVFSTIDELRKIIGIKQETDE